MDGAESKILLQKNGQSEYLVNLTLRADFLQKAGILLIRPARTRVYGLQNRLAITQLSAHHLLCGFNLQQSISTALYNDQTTRMTNISVMDLLDHFNDPINLTQV